VFLKWTNLAEGDIRRLHDFLVAVNPRAAAQVTQNIVSGAGRLLFHPQLGVQLPEFAPRDVRRLIVGDYELRYEVTENGIFVLRVWQAHEDR
jgi:plasmid stabilization system protein ParE